jgi:hypothetical protein
MLLVLLPAPLRADAESTAHKTKHHRASLDAFLKAYSEPVYTYLSRIYSYGMTEYSRYLILVAPNHGYVQCMLHDDDRWIYCEASSGFYKNGQPKLSKKSLRAIKELGFDMDGSKGNYSLDMPLHGTAGLRKTAALMLKTLYLGYGADVHQITMKAPLISKEKLK